MSRTFENVQEKLQELLGDNQDLHYFPQLSKVLSLSESTSLRELREELLVLKEILKLVNEERIYFKSYNDYLFEEVINQEPQRLLSIITENQLGGANMVHSIRNPALIECDFSDTCYDQNISEDSSCNYEELSIFEKKISHSPKISDCDEVPIQVPAFEAKSTFISDYSEDNLCERSTQSKMPLLFIKKPEGDAPVSLPSSEVSTARYNHSRQNSTLSNFMEDFNQELCSRIKSKC